MSTMKSERRPRKDAESAEQPPQEVIDRVAELLPEGALDDAVRGLKPEELSGPGGLLSQLAGRVVEAALEAEMTEHLGHPPGGTPNGPNVRNGRGRKTVQSDLGPVEVRTPRDRDGSFEPQILPKRATRLAGLDDKVLGLYAGGMTVRDISGHLSELPKAAIVISEALERAVHRCSEGEAASLLFGLSGASEGSSLGSRRAAAAAVAGVTAESFRVRRERVLLNEVAHTLLIELATTAPEPAVAGGAHLEVVAGPVRSVLPLPAGRSPVTIGRSPDCDIQLRDDMRVSREHASLTFESPAWVLRDLGSRNGTEGPQGRVRDAVVLADGDVFTIGATRLIFCIEAMDLGATRS